MTRSIASGLLTILDELAHGAFRLVVTTGSGDRWTDHYGTLSYGGASYSSQHLLVRGIGENLNGETPAAEMFLGDLDSTHRATFFADEFRGESLSVRLLYLVGSTWTDTGFVVTYNADADSLPDSRGVMLRLASSDAVEGTASPRRTTQEAGCQWDFMNGRCPFRWRVGMSDSLKKCDKGFDSPNGCKAHFPVVTIAGRSYQPPLPFGGFRGGMSQSLVLS